MNQDSGFERQYPLVALFTFDINDFEGTDPLVLGKLPSKAIITGSFVHVEEAFNTSALTIAAAGAFTMGAIAAASTGRTDGTDPLQPPNTVDVTVTRDTVTDVTGKAHIYVSYVKEGRSQEVQT